jgi:Major Facilitator Superfamily
MAVVFVAYLVIGLAMPVLPLHVHQALGLSTFVVGLVAGSQFAATLISRVWAGHQADTRGAKHAVVTGLLLAAIAGLLYFLSLPFAGTPITSVTILLLGRAVLGAAESFIVAGALIWGLALLGPQNTGTVLAQVGTAMYVAYAIGAPAGTALYAGYSFAAIALATTLVPLLTLLLVAPLRAVAPPAAHARPAFTRVIGAVWVPGLGLAASCIGFGAITTFIVLLFACPKAIRPPLKAMLRRVRAYPFCSEGRLRELCRRSARSWVGRPRAVRRSFASARWSSSTRGMTASGKRNLDLLPPYCDDLRHRPPLLQPTAPVSLTASAQARSKPRSLRPGKRAWQSTRKSDLGLGARSKDRSI